MKTLLVILLVLCTIAKAQENVPKKQLSVTEEFERYSKCNGKNIQFPSKWLPTAIKASLECVGCSDPDCFRLCVVHNYGKIMVDDKVHMKTIRAMGEDLKNEIKKTIKKHSEAEIKSVDSMVDQIEFCSKDKIYPYPKTDETCGDATEFMECFDTKFDEVCKRKREKKTGLSLDIADQHLATLRK